MRCAAARLGGGAFVVMPPPLSSPAVAGVGVAVFLKHVILSPGEVSDSGLQRWLRGVRIGQSDSDAIDAERVTIAIPSLRSLRLRSE